MVSMKAVAPKGQCKAQKCNQKMPKMGKMKKDIVWTELPGGGVDFTLSRRQWYRIMTGLWIGVWAMFLLPFAIDLTLCSVELPRQTAGVLRRAAGASPFSIFRDTGKTRIQRRVPSFTGIVRPRRADDGPPPFDPYHLPGRRLQLRRQVRDPTYRRAAAAEGLNPTAAAFDPHPAAASRTGSIDESDLNAAATSWTPVPLDPAVGRLLDDLGLHRRPGLRSRVGPTLAKKEVDWESLCLLDAADLVDIGVGPDDAPVIVRAVRADRGRFAP